MSAVAAAAILCFGLVPLNLTGPGRATASWGDRFEPNDSTYSATFVQPPWSSSSSMSSYDLEITDYRDEDYFAIYFRGR